jgi:hypothetical protein
MTCCLLEQERVSRPLDLFTDDVLLADYYHLKDLSLLSLGSQIERAEEADDWRNLLPDRGRPAVIAVRV